jgi:DNA polymerase-1
LDSKKLATIITDVPIDIDTEELKIEPFDKDKLRAIFTELEFRTLQRDILGETVSAEKKSGQVDLFNQPTGEPVETKVESPFETIEDISHEYILIEESNINDLKEVLEKANAYAFDTETTGLDMFEDEIVGISFSTEAHKAYYLPLLKSKDESTALLKQLQPYFSDSKKTKIAHNIKFDAQVLYNYGVEVTPPFYDTMVCHFMLDSDSKQGLDFLSNRYLNYQPIKYEELVGKGKMKRNIKTIPIEQVVDYAAEDADITWRLYEKFESEISQERKVNNCYHDIDLPLIPVLGAMERHGVCLDVDFLHQYSDELNEELEKYKAKIYEESGTEFNLDSPKQLGEVLFGKMQIPYKGKKTKTGQFSTGEDVMTSLKKDYPIAQDILDYRELTKLKSTYVDALPKLVHPATGRIHTSYNQTIAATGRLSSTKPNLQNIPIRTERGRRIRKAFIAPSDDYVILSADYSQVELRLMASMSGDETMIEAFQENQDIHQLTASKVFGIPLDEVTKEQRSHAKVVNFGIIYGVSAYGLSQQTDLSMKESKVMIENYFKTYPKIKEFMDKQKEYGHEHGYVETLMGRRRYLRDINSRNQMMRSMYERIAINAPVQGTAADLIKIAMNHIYAKLNEKKYKSAMTIQVHDELVLEVHNSELEAVQKLVIDEMQTAMPNLSVPIIAEHGLGKNWLEAH